MERGAAAVVAGREVRGLLRGTPVVLMPDVPDALSRLAVAFYNAPSEKMTVVGVVGAPPHTASVRLGSGSCWVRGGVIIAPFPEMTGCCKRCTVSHASCYVLEYRRQW